MKKPLLRAENLRKEYASGFALEIPHIEFEAGKTYGLVGPNGAGKTTLLSLLSLLEEPTTGEIFFQEEKVRNSNSLRMRRKMHMIMENPYLFHTTVFKNITAGLKCRALNKKRWPEIAEKALRTMGLEELGKRDASRLSRGETQRVAIARGLVLEPEALFLDEPFTNMDTRSARTLERLITSISQEYDTTIIFTTHDLWQAYRLSDEILSLLGGSIVEGSLENLFKGKVEEHEGLQFVRISPKVSLSVVTRMTGEVNLSIGPQDIVLSHQPLRSSARNSFPGMIKKIESKDETVRVTTEVEGEVDLIALITKASCEKMGLSINSHIFLTFKSTAVRIF